MVKIIISMILFLINASAFCQQNGQAGQISKQDYLRKSKNQNRTGVILLAAGGGLIATSLIIPKGELVRDGICIGVLCDDEYENDGTKSAFFIAGGLSILGSIPFFIASGKNRKRATSVSFTSEHAFYLNNPNIVSTSFPALRVKIDF